MSKILLSSPANQQLQNIITCSIIVLKSMPQVKQVTRFTQLFETESAFFKAGTRSYLLVYCYTRGTSSILNVVFYRVPGFLTGELSSLF